MEKPKRVLGVLDKWLTKQRVPATATPIPKSSDDNIKQISETPTRSGITGQQPKHRQKSPAKSSRKRSRESCHNVESKDENDPDSGIRQRKRRVRTLKSSEDESDDAESHRKQQVPKIAKKKIKVEAESDRSYDSGSARKNVITSCSPKKGTSSKAKPKSSVKDATKALSTSSLPLDGLRIVVTGVFEGITREEMELLVKRSGGHMTTAVSGRTNILIYGSQLEDGRAIQEGSKYRKATELKKGIKADGSKIKASDISILSEQEFFDKYPTTRTKEKGDATLETSPLCFGSQSPSEVEKRVISKIHKEGGKPEQMLWVEKWRPEKVSDILGNGETVKKFMIWLRDWDTVCLYGKLKVPTKSRLGEPERINARAVMLSGPPGVGKTTAARVVAKECAYEILEYNASDDRGKGIVEILNDMTSGGQTLGSFLDKKSPRRAVLVMDEMDGLSGSGDRGGIQALIKLITKTHCPVICICNDRMHPKLRTLAGKCYDLRFNKPPKNIVAKRICEIAKAEGLDVEYNAAELLCERVGNDLRQILNMLQLMEKNVNSVSFDHMRKEIGIGLKDNQVMANPFDTAKRLLTRTDSSCMKFNDKLDCFFVDYDMMPLYMEENYMAAFFSQFQGNITGQREVDAIGVLASVADCYTLADMVNSKVRRQGYWSLLADVGLYSTIVPSCQCNGFLARPEFPKWLGKNSTTIKHKRYLTELQLYLSPMTTTAPTAMRLDGYLDAVYEKILKSLSDSSEDVKEQVQRCVELMDEYGLTKDHVLENIGSLRLKTQDKLYDFVDSSTKRSLTTLYNTSSHAIRMAPPTFSVKRKPGVKGPSKETEEEGSEEGTAPKKEEKEEEQQEDENDEAFLDRLILTKKKKVKTSIKSNPKQKAKSNLKRK